MNLRTTEHGRRTGFTLIELLTVIAIIGLLAAILFPVFSVVREQARESNTMSNMHDIYVAARSFQLDEGHFPNVLFGYAMVQTGANPDTYRPAKPTDTNVLPMDQAVEKFNTESGLANYGYLYGEQIKDFGAFTNIDDTVNNKSAVTIAYYPPNSAYAQSYVKNHGGNVDSVVVTWEAPTQDPNSLCTYYGDSDLPDASYASSDGKNYTSTPLPKLFYKMDSMDISPMLDDLGNKVYEADGVTPKYELNYSPNWSHQLYQPVSAAYPLGCDVGANFAPVVNQLKYQNPPRNRTVITWITTHAAVTGNGQILTLLDDGTAIKLHAAQAYSDLPMNYAP